MDEEAFLRSRQQRQDARQQRQPVGASDDAVARKSLADSLAECDANVKQLLASGDVTAASTMLKVAQELVRTTVDTMKLPAHEVRVANEMLSTMLTAIEAARSSDKPAKKFTFASKKKTSPVVEMPPVVDVLAVTSPEPISVPTSGVVFEGKSNESIFVSPSKAVFVRNCSGCVIRSLPVDGSFFMSDCTDCIVYTACHQMRIKSCSGCQVYVWCSSTPVIESCSAMRFGGYSAWKGLLATDSGVASLPISLKTFEDWATEVGHLRDMDHAKASYQKVDDFHWLKQQKSPNWEAMSEADWAIDTVPFPAAVEK